MGRVDAGRVRGACYADAPGRASPDALLGRQCVSTQGSGRPAILDCSTDTEVPGIALDASARAEVPAVSCVRRRLFRHVFRAVFARHRSVRQSAPLFSG